MAKIAILGSSYSAALIDWRNKNFDINDYPINIGTTAAKFMTSPRIIRELKKEGYL